MKGNLNLPLIKGTHVKARRIAFSRAVKMELWVVSEEHLNSPQVFSRIRVTRSLVLYVCFVDRCLSFCTFSFGHCVVCRILLAIWWRLTTHVIILPSLEPSAQYVHLQLLITRFGIFKLVFCIWMYYYLPVRSTWVHPWFFVGFVLLDL
jgi:hypothetical protein